jgi:hypothetical protein
MSSQRRVWRELNNLAATNKASYHGRVGNMKESNLKLHETLKDSKVNVEGHVKILDVILEDIYRGPCQNEVTFREPL